MRAQVAKPKLPYREGDWFAVPLRRGGFGVGVLARMPPTGGILLGYFFGPKRVALPSLREVAGAAPSTAVLVYRFSHLGLLKGRWPILGASANWQREAWPTSLFGRTDALEKQGWKVTYSDEDPEDCLTEEPCSVAEAKQLPNAGLAGAGAIELLLTDLLDPE